MQGNAAEAGAEAVGAAGSELASSPALQRTDLSDSIVHDERDVLADLQESRFEPGCEEEEYCPGGYPGVACRNLGP